VSGTNSNEMGFFFSPFFLFNGRRSRFPLGFTDGVRHSRQGMFGRKGKEITRSGKKRSKTPLNVEKRRNQKGTASGKKSETRNRVKSERNNEKFDVTFSQ